MLKIILVFAELERKLTAERVYSIMLSRAEKGLWNGANVPLGYKYDKVAKFPVPDMEESKTIQLIFDEYIKSKSTVEVTKLLNNNNVKTKRGGKWTSKTVTDIIRNPFYKGTYRYNYRESARGAIKDEKEWIVIENNHESIIKCEVWEKANKVMDQNARYNLTSFRKKVNVNNHIFANILKCEHCGRNLSAHKDRVRSDGYRPSSYRCQGKLRFFDCDAKMTTDTAIGPFVINYLSNLVHVLNSPFNNLEPELLRGVIFKGVKINEYDLNQLDYMLKPTKINHELKREEPTKKTKIKNTGELTKYKRALDRLENLYLFDDDAMSEKDYLIKKKKLENKIKELEKSSIVATHDECIDLSFLNTCGDVVFKHMILNHEYIDFKSLYILVDTKVIKDFINSIIEFIEIKNGKVYSISLKNGIRQRFSYE